MLTAAQVGGFMRTRVCRATDLDSGTCTAVHRRAQLVHRLPHRNWHESHTKVTGLRVLLPTGMGINNECMAQPLFARTASHVPVREPRRRRQHRSTLRQMDRRALERAGWRTKLEFRENHARLDDGQLIDVEPFWVAEAERDGIVICATARSESRAWSRLHAQSRVDGRDFFEVASA